jgi:hypothetical protein
MALTKVNRGGLNTGIADSSNATFLSVAASEVITVTTGSTTTVLGLGMATHGLHYNQQSHSSTGVKSWNLTSVADDATGEYTVTIASAYADINYIMTNSNNFVANTEGDAIGGQLHSDNSNGNEVAPTTTTYKVRTDGSNDGSSTGGADLKYNYTTIHGELA